MAPSMKLFLGEVDGAAPDDNDPETGRAIEVATGVAVTGHVPGETSTTVQYGDGQTTDANLVVVSVGRTARRSSSSVASMAMARTTDSPRC